MVATPGTTTVPAHTPTRSSASSRTARARKYRLETQGGEQMLISSVRSAVHLSCLSPGQFSDLKSGTFGHQFAIPAGTLRELIERTQSAISTAETRYYLNGIYLHTLETGAATVLRAVATDGHRMARAETDAPEGSKGMPGIIVPKKTVGEVQKLLDGADGDVQVEVSDTKIRFTLGGVVLLSKLIEGTFPDYDRVTPKNNDKTMNVDRASFATAVDRVSTIASERGGKAVKLSVKDGQLELENYGQAPVQLTQITDETKPPKAKKD